MNAVFASWIPEVLAKIEALIGDPEPPSSLVVTRSRQLLVNRLATESAPTITKVVTSEGIGLRFDSELSSLVVQPGGITIAV